MTVATLAPTLKIVLV